MKKILTIILSCALIITCCGCGLILKDPSQTAAPPTTTAGGGTLPPETISQGDQQLPMTSISLPLIQTRQNADDGTLLISCAYQQVTTPILQDADVAEAVALDLMNRIDLVSATAGTLAAQAKNNYSGQTNWVPYSCRVSYDPMRLDSGVLSLYGQTVTYAGGIHPDYAGVSVTYDLVNGSVLSLGDLLTDGCTSETLSNLVIEALNGLGSNYYLYSDFEESVAARFGSNWAQDGSWYLSREGLCFYFSPYDIAPYATGMVVATVPYEKLVGLLEDAYFPVERLTVNGTVEATLFEDAELDSYSQFSEAILDPEGTRFLLHTQGTVYDVRLEQGQWSADGAVFTPDCTVFAASSLTPGDAIMVQAMFPDVLSPLRLTYRSGEADISFHLYQSGKDGTIVFEKA